ncbi:hypothetical protein BD626DRAFT_499651 [Schizophyllum amplum]|uniref:Uncharacterized protein n=1 Tax=Schizophyllum amplum TaxID=97359 RepID=A0A550CB84_9AGAR|nr:hypothetical protein BD626DRAFT_499651 [Auriculariopsis ampla]
MAYELCPAVVDDRFVIDYMNERICGRFSRSRNPTWHAALPADRRGKHISTIASDYWNLLSSDKKGSWCAIAGRLADLHTALHPEDEDQCRPARSHARRARPQGPSRSTQVAHHPYSREGRDVRRPSSLKPPSASPVLPIESGDAASRNLDQRQGDTQRNQEPTIFHPTHPLLQNGAATTSMLGSLLAVSATTFPCSSGVPSEATSSTIARRPSPPTSYQDCTPLTLSSVLNFDIYNVAAPDAHSDWDQLHSGFPMNEDFLTGWVSPQDAFSTAHSFEPGWLMDSSC